jgi:hypothetical protein
VGIVYRVDAINNGQVWIIDEAPAGTDTPVQFGQAVVWICWKASLGVAEEFSDFIMSPRIQNPCSNMDLIPCHRMSKTTGLRTN